MVLARAFRTSGGAVAALIIEDAERNAVAGCGVCMRCGRPAAAVRRHKFSWFPPWVYSFLGIGPVGLLPVAVLAVVIVKYKQLDVPLCGVHKYHWIWWRVLTLASVFGLMSTVPVALLAAASPHDWFEAGLGHPYRVCASAVAVAVACLAVMAMSLHAAIRPQRITDGAISLTNVSDEFVRSYLRSRPDFSGEIGRLVRERLGDGTVSRGVGGSDHIRGQEDDNRR
jgi:hypothetical protein